MKMRERSWVLLASWFSHCVGTSPCVPGELCHVRSPRGGRCRGESCEGIQEGKEWVERVYWSCWSYIWPPTPRGLGLYRALLASSGSTSEDPGAQENYDVWGTYNMLFLLPLQQEEERKELQIDELFMMLRCYWQIYVAHFHLFLV